MKVLTEAAVIGRRLDAANPSIDTLAKDFARLGLRDLPADLARTVPSWRAVARDVALLIALRNAIAHGDAGGRSKAIDHGANVTVAWVGSARARLDTVATALDDLLWTSLRSRYGREPW